MSDKVRVSNCEVNSVVVTNDEVFKFNGVNAIWIGGTISISFVECACLVLVALMPIVWGPPEEIGARGIIRAGPCRDDRPATILNKGDVKKEGLSMGSAAAILIK